MNIPLAKLIPWKGSKAQLMWAIQSLMPIHYNKLVDVFGGSGCVTLNLQTPRGVLRIYNDLDSNLYNMMYCVREKPVSVITELKYMQNSREEFETMLRALKDKDFAGKNLAEELELTQISFPPAQAEEISAMLMQRAIPPDAQRAAMFFLLHNLSYNGLGTEFAALDRDWDRFEHQITRCARILQHIPMENRSYKDILSKYDAPDTVFYCDPPYLGAEKYGVPFYRSDHQELHDMIQNLSKELFELAEKGSGRLPNRVVFFCDEFGTMPAFDVEALFSAGRSRGIMLVPIIQSLAQLNKNYGDKGAEILADNCQDTIFGGFAPNSQTAEKLSKALGSRTVLSGSVSKGKNDPSQSLQMIERPLMTPDELKSLPKGTFVVMKTGVHPMQTKLKLFLDWGITFGTPYATPEHATRKVAYASREELFRSVRKAQQEQNTQAAQAKQSEKTDTRKSTQSAMELYDDGGEQ